MLSARLIQLIETHADGLTREVLQDLRVNPRTRSFHRVPIDELRSRIYELYIDLGRWLAGARDDAIRRDYEEWGQRRLQQGIPLSEIVYALILFKHHLRSYIRDHGLVASSTDAAAPPEVLPVHLYGIQELNYLVGEFFDKALYYLACGYEREAAAAAQAATRHP